MRQSLRDIFAATLEKWGGTLLECNGEADHPPLLFEVPPTVQLSKCVNNLKTVSSATASAEGRFAPWRHCVGAGRPIRLNLRNFSLYFNALPRNIPGIFLAMVQANAPLPPFRKGARGDFAARYGEEIPRVSPQGPEIQGEALKLRRMRASSPFLSAVAESLWARVGQVVSTARTLEPVVLCPELRRRTAQCAPAVH
jgi:hypothetical protein